MLDDVRIVRSKPQNLALDPFAAALGGDFEIYCGRQDADNPREDGVLQFRDQGMSFPWDGSPKTICLIFTLQFMGIAAEGGEVTVQLRPPSSSILRTNALAAYTDTWPPGEVGAGSISTQLVTAYPHPAMNPPLFIDTPIGLHLSGPSANVYGFDYSMPFNFTLSITAMVATWTTDGCYEQMGTE